MAIEVDGHKIDDVSQQLLVLLRDSSTLTTPELSDDLGVETSRLHYRIDEHLRPAGLVEQVDTGKSAPGAARAPSSWAITDAGRILVAERRDDMPPAAARAEAVKSVDRLAERVDELTGKINDMEAQIGQFEQEQDNRSEWGDRLDELERNVESLQADLGEKADASDLDEKADSDDLSGKVDGDDLEDAVNRMREQMQEQLDKKADVDDLEEKVDDDEIDDLEDEVAAAYTLAQQANNRGLIDLLTR
jgi:predicted ArsR family transcriptional regulator